MRACGHGLGADILSPKTASYAVMHFVVAILVAYALTLDWRPALAIGLIEPFVQTFAFALHDRYWRRRGERRFRTPQPRMAANARTSALVQ